MWNKMKYGLRVLSGVRLTCLKKSLDKAKERSGKNRVLLFFDILWCALRYGAGHHDYVMFAFYNMDGKHRDTYVTRLRNKKIIVAVNDPQAADDFDEKSRFYQRFSKFLGREFLLPSCMTQEELAAFMENREVLFAKPDVGESGKGIERLEKKDFRDISQLYAYIQEKNFGVIEEELRQHPQLTRLYPGSVNSMRVVTLLTGEKSAPQAHCVYAVQKIGGGGRFVDNLENGGMFCPVDLETGKLSGVGHTSALTTLERHPITGVELIGYSIPFVREAVELCLEAALVEPRMGLIGWDVCITEKGPVIVEGNDYPGYDFWQQPEHTPDQIGLWPYYKKMLPQL